MRTITNKNFPNERDLYGENGLYLKDCTFDGVEDGESALKEASNIKLESCYMNLRYPLWHDDNVEFELMASAVYGLGINVFFNKEQQHNEQMINNSSWLSRQKDYVTALKE